MHFVSRAGRGLEKGGLAESCRGQGTGDQDIPPGPCRRDHVLCDSLVDYLLLVACQRPRERIGFVCEPRWSRGRRYGIRMVELDQVDRRRYYFAAAGAVVASFFGIVGGHSLIEIVWRVGHAVRAVESADSL